MYINAVIHILFLKNDQNIKIICYIKSSEINAIFFNIINNAFLAKNMFHSHANVNN